MWDWWFLNEIPVGLCDSNGLYKFKLCSTLECYSEDFDP